MTTWILVWFLVFPPTEANNEVKWEAVQQGGVTMQQCFEMLAEKDVELKQLEEDGKISGHQIFCKKQE